MYIYIFLLLGLAKLSFNILFCTWCHLQTLPPVIACTAPRLEVSVAANQDYVAVHIC